MNRRVHPIDEAHEQRAKVLCEFRRGPGSWRKRWCKVKHWLDLTVDPPPLVLAVDAGSAEQSTTAIRDAQGNILVERGWNDFSEHAQLATEQCTVLLERIRSYRHEPVDFSARHDDRLDALAYAITAGNHKTFQLPPPWYRRLWTFLAQWWRK